MKGKIIALVASAAIGMTFVQGAKEEKPVQATQENVAADWTPLFDGKTFAGWSKYGGGEVGKAWKIQNGELYLDAANKATWQTGVAGDIVTEEEYENFHI